MWLGSSANRARFEIHSKIEYAHYTQLLRCFKFNMGLSLRSIKIVDFAFVNTKEIKSMSLVQRQKSLELSLSSYLNLNIS